MKHLAVSFATCAALALVSAVSGPPAFAAPPADELLPTTTHVTYDVRPENGPVTVTWQVTVRNNDPDTVFNEFGSSLYYASYPVPVLRGASGLNASGAGGGSLGVSTEDKGDPLITAAHVSLGDGLFYGESYSFTFSYQLPAARHENLLVTPAYVFLPAITTGDSTTISVVTPEGSGEWRSNIDEIDCAESSVGQYACSAPTEIVVGALVEVVRPGQLQTLDSSVEMSDPPRTVPLAISFFPGEDVWAQRVQDLARPALPLMNRLFGFETGDAIDITEVGQQEIFGYGGRAGCLGGQDDCAIELSPTLGDHGILHEFAHLWTPIDSDAWIAEGMAEWMSWHIVEALSLSVTNERFDVPPPREPFHLDGWSPGLSVLDASEDELNQVYGGYVASLAFFESIESRIGEAKLIEAYRRLIDVDSSPDSERFLDSLEFVSGDRLDNLFRSNVFAPEFGATLDKRRQALDQVAFLTPVAAAAGLELTENIQTSIDGWYFDTAIIQMDEAAGALTAYAGAKERLDEPRSWLERFGLHGENPDADMEGAAAAFLTGQYDQTIALAEEAEAAVDEAQTTGVYRLGVAIAMFVLVAGAFALALLIGRRARRSQPLPAVVAAPADAGSALRSS